MEYIYIPYLTMLARLLELELFLLHNKVLALLSSLGIISDSSIWLRDYTFMTY